MARPGSGTYSISRYCSYVKYESDTPANPHSNYEYPHTVISEVERDCEDNKEDSTNCYCSASKCTNMAIIIPLGILHQRCHDWVDSTR